MVEKQKLIIKAKLLVTVGLLFLISACTDKIGDDLAELTFTDIGSFNRQFYETGDRIYVLFAHSFYDNTDRLDNKYSSITYGAHTDETNVKFHIYERSLDHYQIVTQHRGNFIADLDVNKITYTFSVPGVLRDYRLDTGVRVFENRRVDFLMDKLAPKDLKSTHLEQVFIGENKIKAPNASYLSTIPGYMGPRGTYKEIKEADENTFLGLYGRTAIYGNHTIDSVAVRHGVLAYDENIMNMVREDILDVYDAIVVKDSENEMILETEELIFRTMAHWCWVRECDLRNVPAVVTTVKRKQ